MTNALYTLLAQFQPDPDALLRAITPLMTDDMLMSIAIADYGMGVEAHFAALKTIRDENFVPIPMQWEPHEVLTLTHWSEPDKYWAGRPERLKLEHLERAFACTVLLRAEANPENDGLPVGACDICAPLLDSLPHLDQGLHHPAIQFFAWCALNNHTFEIPDHPFINIALLLLLLRTGKKFTRGELRTLVNAVYDQVIYISKAYPATPRSDDKAQWLTWLTYYAQRHVYWQAFGAEIARYAETYNVAEGRLFLCALTRHLVEIPGKDQPAKID
jgi:hypothetical protein